MDALNLLLALLASAALLGLLYRRPLAMPWNRSRTTPAEKAQRNRRPKSTHTSATLPIRKQGAAEDARDQDGPSFNAMMTATQVIVPRADVPRLSRVAAWPWPADPSVRITVTDDLDRALLSVQIEIIDRVRRQEETELLGEPDTGAPPPLLLVATPGDARERIEAVLALGRPYGITGLLLEEDRSGLSLDDASDMTALRTDRRRARAAQVPGVSVLRGPEAEVQPGRSLDVRTGQSPAGSICLLGRYVVEGDTEQCASRNKDMWALLGLLAEHRTTLLSRRTAEAKIWPDQDAGDHRFPTLIKDTRAKLCDALGRPYDHGKYVIENIGISGYRINPGIYTCDVWQLRDRLADAAKATGAQRAAALAKAVELRTGPYLPESPHGWALNASRALDREIVQAFAELARLQTDPERAVSYLEEATSIDTTAEHLYRRRMQTYADLGRPEAIHHCYEELISHLTPRAKNPERKTIELYERLVQEV